MALSAFSDRAHPPTDADLRLVLGRSHTAWSRLIALVDESLAPISRDWGYTSAGTGWGLRIRHKGRVLLYMTPSHGHFLASFALGEKAVEAARDHKLSASVLAVIEKAPKYAEGRGVRFEVRSIREVRSLVTLAQIKRAH